MPDDVQKPDVPSFPYPSDRIWFDPSLIAAATSVYIHDETIVFNVIKQLAIPDVRRWGIGFKTDSAGFTFNVAPWPDVNLFVFAGVTLSASIPFFTLFNYGSIVSNGWFANSSFGGSIRVVELLRQ